MQLTERELNILQTGRALNDSLVDFYHMSGKRCRPAWASCRSTIELRCLEIPSKQKQEEYHRNFLLKRVEKSDASREETCN